MIERKEDYRREIIATGWVHKCQAPGCNVEANPTQDNDGTVDWIVLQVVREGPMHSAGMPWLCFHTWGCVAQWAIANSDLYPGAQA